MIKLIVNADDFGLTEGVNRAIRDAHLHGILTSTTLMANGEAFHPAVSLAQGLPSLGVGVHLNLTQGFSVSAANQIPSLVNQEGLFIRTAGRLTLALSLGHIRKSEIEKELSAQIEKVLDTGILPTHLDGHKHFHLWPSLYLLVVRLARQYKIPAVRLASCPLSLRSKALIKAHAHPLKIHKQQAIAISLSFVSRIDRWLSRQREILSTDHFWGVAETGFLNEKSLQEILKNLTPGIHELMCHPGYLNDSLTAIPTRLLIEREVELQALTQPGLREGLAARGIQLIHYGNLENTVPI
jgi:chitin disaccharide deacetylase